MPHDHRMWAVIGVYTGREDNIFWRHVPDAQGGLIEAAGAKSLSERRAAAGPRHHSFGDQSLGPPDRCDPRLWRRFLRRRPQRLGPRNLLERDYDYALHRRMFEEANAET